MKSLFLFFIRAYQLCIRPFLGPCCRFFPSCSEYAEEALHRHRCNKALLLIGKRLVKCGPWHRGGLDPVPPPKDISIVDSTLK